MLMMPQGEAVTEEYKYTCEMDTKRKWTPLNSNLHMQGINVNQDNLR